LPEAQYELAKILENGKGVPKDHTAAMKWYLSSANNGGPGFKTMLANQYRKGDGVFKKNDAEAVKWFRIAAEQGYRSAQAELAFMSYYGEGMTQNYSQAILWFRKAALQGHDKAQYTLGEMYRDGKGCSNSIVNACVWWSLVQGRCKKNAESNLNALKMNKDQLAQAKGKIDLIRSRYPNLNTLTDWGFNFSSKL